MLALLSCGAPPQAKDEAAITYRLKFSAEAGVRTEVVFPVPLDAAQMTVQSSLTPGDGGTLTFVMSREGPAASLVGQGAVEAVLSVKKVSGFPSGDGIPDAVLSLQVPDAGTADRFVQVNKGGSATAHIEFEYTASRDCGAGCGGKRSWKYAGPTGVTWQQIHMEYVEEER